jgi:hypothetical protein
MVGCRQCLRRLNAVTAQAAYRRDWRPARDRRPLAYSSPLCSRKRWRSRPMKHPIANAANRNAMITPMLTSTWRERYRCRSRWSWRTQEVCINASVQSVERTASPVHALRCFWPLWAGGEIGQTIGNGYRDNRPSRIYDWFREMD